MQELIYELIGKCGSILKCECESESSTFAKATVDEVRKKR